MTSPMVKATTQTVAIVRKIDKLCSAIHYLYGVVSRYLPPGNRVRDTSRGTRHALTQLTLEDVNTRTFRSGG